MTIKHTLFSLAVAGSIAVSGAALAGSKADADRLGKGLTPTGAEMAGNADGTIPAWTGGLTTPPANLGYKGPGDHHPDPFADEKPLFTITADNYQQHSDKLTEGQKALFIKYPDSYKMSVYPTHRTHAAPQWIYDNIKKNAVNASLSQSELGVENAYGGTPFPVPQTGSQVMWNHLLRWQGQATEYVNDTVLVQANGSITTGGEENYEKHSYYQKDKKDQFTGEYYTLVNEILAPTSRKGETLLFIDPVNLDQDDRKAWIYIPGARRVRRAPNVGYDGPDGASSGTRTYNDNFIFNGAMDRFDWKLVGKKEIYIPYNAYKMDDPSLKYTDLATPNHLNPEHIRYELHRVWVVDATLAEGKRHVYGKRTFYFDEDSWVAVLQDSYDNRGELWRVHEAQLKAAYELPGVVQRGFTTYDLNSGVYHASMLMNEQTHLPIYTIPRDDKFYSVAGLRKRSKR
ncbi:DUF1329 domain-containing protein [Amphritea sp. HPY]|uniref:DUF1329 domain-containing protein n=1 Tax=Amphritea sp. HPY TaxID=3421652 RepID=UPI003D7E28C5